jgi:hypothetical protein
VRVQTSRLDDRGSFSWIARPSDPLLRTSTAVAVDGGVLLVDPVDAPGLDAALGALGPAVGVTYLIQRHARDVGPVAARLGAPVVVPAVLAGLGEPLRVPGVEERVILAAPGWNESALWLPDRGLLVCGDVLGTIGYFLAAPDERLGIHPLLRPRPPRRALGGIAPRAIAVGHGAPVVEGAAAALHEALATARRRLPEAWTRGVARSVRGAVARARTP